MDAKIIPFPFHASARDRARAKLYQAEAPLLQTGIRAESIAGRPTRAIRVRRDTGEIIALVALIDGEVVADSPAFNRLMRGQDIGEIFDRMVARL